MDEPVKNEIRIVDGSYAAIKNERVIGIVDRYSDSGWKFTPLVEGSGDTTHPVPLAHALKQAVDFR